MCVLYVAPQKLSVLAGDAQLKVRAFAYETKVWGSGAAIDFRHESEQLVGCCLDIQMETGSRIQHLMDTLQNCGFHKWVEHLLRLLYREIYVTNGILLFCSFRAKYSYFLCIVWKKVWIFISYRFTWKIVISALRIYRCFSTFSSAESWLFLFESTYFYTCIKKCASDTCFNTKRRF